MTTFLAQNQYFPNSVAQPPGSVAADTAAAPPQPPGAAAGPIDEPSMTNGGAWEAPAAAAPVRDTTAGATNHIPEIFYWVRKLMKGDPDAEEHRFVPDYAALYQATIDDDPLPLFLQRDAE